MRIAACDLSLPSQPIITSASVVARNLLCMQFANSQQSLRSPSGCFNVSIPYCIASSLTAQSLDVHLAVVGDRGHEREA